MRNAAVSEAQRSEQEAEVREAGIPPSTKPTIKGADQ